MALARGHSIGSYRIVGGLRQSAVIETYRATDSGDRPVVLKLLGNGALDAPTLSKIQALARKLMTAKSSRLVNWLEIGFTKDAGGSRAFFVREFIEGRTLAQILDETSTPELPVVMSIGKELLGALGEIHRQGVVVKNLKPTNVVFPGTGPLRITDAGFWMEDPSEPTVYQFYSPEQQATGDGDFRSDLFSFGAILYRALAGSLPFPACAPDALLAHKRHPHRAPVPRGSRSLSRLVESLLAASPAQRPRSVDEALETLFAAALSPGFPEASGTQIPSGLGSSTSASSISDLIAAAGVKSPRAHQPRPARPQTGNDPISADRPDTRTDPFEKNGSEKDPASWNRSDGVEVTGPPERHSGPLMPSIPSTSMPSTSVPSTSVPITPTRSAGLESDEPVVLDVCRFPLGDDAFVSQEQSPPPSPQDTEKDERPVVRAVDRSLIQGIVVVSLIVATMGALWFLPSGEGGLPSKGTSSSPSSGGSAVGRAGEPSMVYVPPAEVILSDEFGQEAPRSMKGFWIDRTEVTNGQFAQFITATRYQAQGPWRSTAPSGTDSYPVRNVTYGDAMAFCGWIHRRLPTSMEWEYAARWTDRRPYPWGAQKPDPARLFCGFRKDPCPVGSYPEGRSAFGAMDLTGNVWEWTSERDGRSSTVRGAAFNSPAELLMLTVSREVRPIDLARPDCGFRCAVTP